MQDLAWYWPVTGLVHPNWPSAGEWVSNPAACAIIDHIDPGPESMEQLLPGNTLKCGQVQVWGVEVEGIKLH